MKNHVLGILLGLTLSAISLRANDLPRPKGPEEDGTLPALVKIAGEGTMDSHAFQYLTELSDQVGARVTGTPSAQRAIDWGLTKMKVIGLQNVHAEKWSMWKGWTRGKAEAELLEPLHHTLTIDAMGWTGSTPANGVEAEVVAANLFDLDEEIRNVARFHGKIILMSPKGRPKKGFDAIFAQFGDFLRAAYKAGAAAVIGGQGGFKAEGMHLTHTGILGFAADFAIPVVDMTREDDGQLERYLNNGQTVRVRMNVQNTFSAGPVDSANVIGEIPGREHPEQIFVVGAHLDSWDLSQGATDNGTGTTSVLAAADAIVKSGLDQSGVIEVLLDAFAFHRPDDLRELVHQAGFADVSCRTVRMLAALPSVSQWVRVYPSLPPLSQAWRRCTQEARIQFLSRVTELLRPFEHDGVLRVQASSRLVVARAPRG